MKLVDLNQTIFVPVVDETKGGMTIEMKMTVEEFFRKFCQGFEPKIVEAIPVEWLKARKTKYYEDWGLVPVSVGEALTMWQKEQEAR